MAPPPLLIFMSHSAKRSRLAYCALVNGICQVDTVALAAPCDAMHYTAAIIAVCSAVFIDVVAENASAQRQHH
jgi:hypothetical protein